MLNSIKLSFFGHPVGLPFLLDIMNKEQELVSEDFGRMVWDDDWLRECATNACFQLPTGREEDGQLGDGFRLRHIYPAWCNIIVSTYYIHPGWCNISVYTYNICPGWILFSSPYIWFLTWLWFLICQIDVDVIRSLLPELWKSSVRSNPYETSGKYYLK